MRTMKTLPFIALSILLSSPAILHRDAQAAPRVSARAAIEAQSGSFTAALEKGDAAEAARNFTADARLSVPYAAFGADHSELGAGDRVGLPHDYATAMRRVSDTVYNERSGLTTVFANDLAASTAGSSQQHYPQGAVILMEFAQPVRNGQGELLRDARGVPLKGPIDHIDVMRRGPGLGAAYGAERAGEWEFASYRPDGSVRVASDKAAHCAACHRKAGADKDFVFRTRPWLSH
jgi:hypothetical protein